MAFQSLVQIFRDFVVDGVASSGRYDPRKSEIRAWGVWVERLVNAGGIGGAVWKASKALLLADLAHASGSLAVVYEDSDAENNGMWVKSGGSGTGSWTQITTFLPGYQFITATDDGNSAVNAYSMTTSPRLPFSDGVALIEFIVPFTNTSNTVTISFDAETPLTIKTASGNSPAIGGLIQGMPISGVKIGTNFYMRSDQASAAVLTQAETILNETQEVLDTAVDNLTNMTSAIRDDAQAAATEAHMYADMIGAAIYDFNVDSDPLTPGYDWND